jgi:hypothetical protein
MDKKYYIKVLIEPGGKPPTAREEIVEWLRSQDLCEEDEIHSAGFFCCAADEIELLETERNEAWVECDRLRSELESMKQGKKQEKPNSIFHRGQVVQLWSLPRE